MLTGLPLNLDYIKTKPGMFKAIGVLVHLVAMSLTAAAYNTGRYYEECKVPSLASLFPGPGPGPNPGLLRPGYIPPSVYACDGKEKFCLEFVESFRPILDRKEKIKKDPQYVQFVQMANMDVDIMDDFPTSCPHTWIVLVPVILVVIMWIASLLMLIVFLVIKPETYPVLIKAKKKQKAVYLKKDFILHIINVAGLALSTLLVLSFLIWAFVGNYPCTDRLYKNQLALIGLASQLQSSYYKLGPSSLRSKSTNGESRLVGINVTATVFGRGGVVVEYESCFEETDAVYKLSLLLVGMLLLVATSVLYVIVIYLLNKQSRVGAVGQSQAAQDPQAQAQQPILSSQSSQQAYPQQGYYPQQAYPQQAYPQQAYPQQGYPQPLNPST